MNTKWEGLWKQNRQGFYAGPVIKKGEIPKYTRIVLRYNKYYEKDTRRPRFVYCFADSEGYEEKCVPLEYDERRRMAYEEGYLYTYDEVQYAILRATQDAMNGYTDNIVTDYLPDRRQ